MNIKHLRYFAEAADCGSIRGAADAMNVAPSSVSRQITELETRLEISLLERHGRGCRPTEAGVWLLDYYRAQTEALKDTLEKLVELRGLKRGQVSIALGEGFAAELMATPFKRFQEQYPDVVFQVQTGGTGEIVKLVTEDAAHIGLLMNPPRGAKVKSHIQFERALMVAVHAEHPLAKGKGPIRASDLAQYPLAVKFGSYGVRQLIQNLEAREGVRFKISLQTNSNRVIRDFVGLGYGAGLLSATGADLAGTRLLLKRVDSDILNNIPSHVITRAGRRLPLAARHLLKFLIEHIKTTGS